MPLAVKAIRPGTFFPVAKPELRALTLEQVNDTATFLKLAKSVPGTCWIVSSKIDGDRSQGHFDGQNVTIYSDTGQRVNLKRIPTVLASLKRQVRGNNWVLDGELEMVDDEGNALGHSAIAGYLHKSGPPDAQEKNVRYTFWDILYLNGKDLSSLPYRKRVQILRQTVKTGGPLRFVKFAEVVAKGIPGIRDKVTSPEGIVIRDAESTYWQTNRLFKSKFSFEIYVIVTKVKQTKNGLRVYTGKTRDGYVLGDTFPSDIKANVGDVIRVVIETINEVKDKSGKVIGYAWTIPRHTPLKDKPEPTRKDVDSIQKVKEIFNILQRRRKTLASASFGFAAEIPGYHRLRCLQDLPQGAVESLTFAGTAKAFMESAGLCYRALCDGGSLRLVLGSNESPGDLACADGALYWMERGILADMETKEIRRLRSGDILMVFEVAKPVRT